MTKEIEKRFKEKINITDGCWIWTAAKFHHGHGAIKVNGKMIKAHRLSWELVNGPIPENLVVRHLCNNSSCVKVDHLALGTQKDNVHDMIKAGRHGHKKATHCKNGHEFNEANTYHVIKKGSRNCRVCDRERQKLRRML